VIITRMTKAQINAKVHALFATDVNFPGSLGSKRGAVAFNYGNQSSKTPRPDKAKARGKRATAAYKA
jgi:hypothetical protein